MPRSIRNLATKTTPLQRLPLHRRPLVVAVGSGAMGFICGAMVWHALGFWSFVSTVVLRGPQEATQRTIQDAEAASSAARQQVPAHLRPTGSISPVRPSGATRAAAKAQETCSLAIPDTATAETQVVPCPQGTPMAPARALARKGDLLETTAVAPPPASPPPPPTPPSWTPTIRGAAR